MRLVCPNCSAQYEVDGSMIPDDGRDVQCSNCGHTWFELPGPRQADEDSLSASDMFAGDGEDEAFADAPEPAAEDESPVEEASAEATVHDDDGYEEIEEPAETSRRETRPKNLSREVFEDDDDHAASDDDSDDAKPEAEEAEPEDDTTSDAIRALTSAAAAVDTPEGEETEKETGDRETDADRDYFASTAPRQRRPADAAALDILREEAEREMSQRRAQPSENLETQPDLGLENIRHRRTPSRALRARMAHLGEEMPEDRDEAPERKAPSPDKTRLIDQPMMDADDGYEEPRRDLLPDIEEINSTLRTSPGGPEAVEAKRRSGFRAGFLLILFLTVAAIFAYAQAPAIARALPESEPTLTAFLDWTNGLRDQIDGLIGN